MPHNSKLHKTRIAGGIALINETSTYYDDWVYLHMDSNTKTHVTACTFNSPHYMRVCPHSSVIVFFPWHRWYMDAFERALKDECQFKGTIPYWDWTKGETYGSKLVAVILIPLPDVANVKASPIFNGNTTYGLGTWGTQQSGWRVTDGAFAKTIRAYPVPHIIQRNYTPQVRSFAFSPMQSYLY